MKRGLTMHEQSVYIISSKNGESCPESYHREARQDLERMGYVVFESAEVAQRAIEGKVSSPRLDGYYCGRRGRSETWICRPDHLPLSRTPSQENANYSPRIGWLWGSKNDDPIQTALAILYNHTRDEALASTLSRRFMTDFVSVWGDDWELAPDEIDAWLAERTR